MFEINITKSLCSTAHFICMLHRIRTYNFKCVIINHKLYTIPTLKKWSIVLKIVQRHRRAWYFCIPTLPLPWCHYPMVLHFMFPHMFSLPEVQSLLPFPTDVKHPLFGRKVISVYQEVSKLHSQESMQYTYQHFQSTVR